MLENTEATVKPVTPLERMLNWIRNHRIYLALLAVVIITFLVILLSSGEHRGRGIGVSVPGEWIEDYYASFGMDRGSDSYHFFANMVRSLTQEPLIKYSLNETETDQDAYNEARKNYLDSMLSLTPREYPLPGSNVFHSLCVLNLPPDRNLQNYREIFSLNLDRMNNYGVMSYTGLYNPEWGPEDTGMSLFFVNPSTFRMDSELMLNQYLPYGDSSAEPPFLIDASSSNPGTGLVQLNWQGRPGNFNQDIYFSGSQSPQTDVLNRQAEVGFYLKYKDDNTSEKRGGCSYRPATGGADNKGPYREMDLRIGKVYSVWSGNIPRRQLLWLYNQYIGPAAEDFKARNSSIDLNHHWLPDKYPYVTPGISDSLQAVHAEKELMALEPGNTPLKVNVYYDHDEMGGLVDMMIKRTNATGKVRFTKAMSMPHETFLREMNKTPDLKIYIYGVSIHSQFNLPTEVVTRSFWYRNKTSELWQDVRSLVENFKHIPTSGDPDAQEAQQYSQIERALTIGTDANRKGGMFPLFTVPYVMIYNHSKVSDLSFNTTRGFLELQSSGPLRRGSRRE